MVVGVLTDVWDGEIINILTDVFIIDVLVIDRFAGVVASKNVDILADVWGGVVLLARIAVPPVSCGANALPGIVVGEPIETLVDVLTIAVFCFGIESSIGFGMWTAFNANVVTVPMSGFNFVLPIPLEESILRR